MSLKIEFVERAQKGEKLARLCREFGISRTTGHKWMQRFREQGYAGLEEETRRPKTTPLATAEELVMAVLEAREAHPKWGPKKLEVLLCRRFKEQAPSERTIARILHRAQLVSARRRKRPRNIVEGAPQTAANAPNEVWTVDFKGWWRSADKRRCEPLTVRDAFSRFVFAAHLCSTKKDETKAVFVSLFRKYGVPLAIQCDNGVPFVSVRSPGGLSALSAWWTTLGIRIVRSRPSCPQDNGAHERMHRDICQEVQASPEKDLSTQQRQLDKWRQDFNHVRPHQALSGKTPAEVYRSFDKAPPPVAEPKYPETCRLVRVYPNGNFKLGRDAYFLSTSLAGHIIALEPVDALRMRVWFHHLDLGLIEVEPMVDDSVYDSLLGGLNPKAA